MTVTSDLGTATSDPDLSTSDLTVDPCLDLDTSAENDKGKQNKRSVVCCGMEFGVSADCVNKRGKMCDISKCQIISIEFVCIPYAKVENVNVL